LPQISENVMAFRRIKSLSVAAFSLLLLLSSTISFAQHKGDQHLQKEDKVLEASDEKGGEGHDSKKFDANEVIFGHVMDAHQFHFFSYKGSNGEQHHATIPLPVILLSPDAVGACSVPVNFTTAKKLIRLPYCYPALSRVFKEGGMQDNEIRLLSDEQIVAVDNAGRPLPNIKVYDLSITRNVVQMFLALIVLVWLMLSVAKRYRNGQGVTSAPKGWQNAIEPVIQFYTR
jgi:F-type H+-transporting ATPase subunit a